MVAVELRHPDSAKVGNVLYNLENPRRMTHFRYVILLSFLVSQLAIMVGPSISSAQSTAPPTSAAGKKESKRTTINFEDQLIEGRTQKPELFVLLQNRMNNSRRLFKLRENFVPEMRKTAEDVGRAESNVRGSAEPAK